MKADVESPNAAPIGRHALDRTLMEARTHSTNCCPARIVFAKTSEAKKDLMTCMTSTNVEKTRNAPVTAILAYDLEFHEKLPALFPHGDARSWFVGDHEPIDCGPMSGFDNVKVDAAFFSGAAWRSNSVCSLGHGDSSRLHPRDIRLDFNEARKIA